MISKVEIYPIQPNVRDPDDRTKFTFSGDGNKICVRLGEGYGECYEFDTHELVSLLKAFEARQ